MKKSKDKTDLKYIKIFRLKDGTDIISFFARDEDNLVVMYPVSFYVDIDLAEETQAMVLQYWLPLNLIEENYGVLASSDVLLELTPKKDFANYYLNFLGGITTPKEPTHILH